MRPMLRPFSSFVHPAIRRFSKSDHRVQKSDYGVSKPDTRAVRLPTHRSKSSGSGGIANASLASMCNKTSFLMTAVMNIFFAGLMAKLLDSLNQRAPVGYQDESGFHFGNRKS